MKVGRQMGDRRVHSGLGQIQEENNHFSLLCDDTQLDAPRFMRESQSTNQIVTEQQGRWWRPPSSPSSHCSPFKQTADGNVFQRYQVILVLRTYEGNSVGIQEITKQKHGGNN